MTRREWIEQWFFDVVPVADMPTPKELGQDERPCIALPGQWLRRRWRQLVPRRGGRDCCWYHDGDWHPVCTTAIRLVRAAEAARESGGGIEDQVLAAADAEGILARTSPAHPSAS